MADILMTRSGGRALAAACAAAWKVWAEEAEYAGVQKIGPVCYADGTRVPKNAPELTARGHLYEGPYTGTLFKRVIAFRFHDRGIVEAHLTGELGYAFPGDRPSIYWSVARVVVFRWARRRNEPTLVELVRLKPDQLGKGIGLAGQGVNVPAPLP